MGLPPMKHHDYTLEDWKTWEGRWELINGVAYDMTPAPSTIHQEIPSNLHFTLRLALEEASPNWEAAIATYLQPRQMFTWHRV